jgi:hypothetical protein
MTQIFTASPRLAAPGTGHCIMPVRCGHWLFAVQAGGTQAQRHRPRRSGGAAPYMA